jgi:hypothetical protein
MVKGSTNTIVKATLSGEEWGENEAPKESPKTPTPKPSQRNSMHHKMPLVTKPSIATESGKKS